MPLNDYLKLIFGYEFVRKFDDDLRVKLDTQLLSSYLFIEENKAYYHPSSLKAFLYFLKVGSIKTKLKISYVFLFHLIKELFKIKIQSSKIFIQTLNGIIIINLDTEKVLKVISPIDSEPNFILNEKIANKFIPDYVPKMTKSIVGKSLCCIENELISDYEIMRLNRWIFISHLPFQNLFKLYRNYGFEEVPLIDYLNDFKNEIIEIEKQTPFKGELKQIQKFLIHLENFILNNGISNKNIYYKTMTHGDMMPSNVFRKDQKYIIFDWANGGVNNFFYDLMIQEFYWPDSYVWKNFHKLDFKDFSKKKNFKNLGNHFINFIEKKTSHKLDIEFIKISIIFSLFEMAIKNAKRHSYNSYFYNEGEEILKIVNKIFLNIEKSLEKV